MKKQKFEVLKRYKEARDIRFYGEEGEEVGERFA